MSETAYLITEGVTDAYLISRVLRRYFGMMRIQHRSDLPREADLWLQSFRWPVEENISRLTVPAPIFMQAQDRVVAIRNAEGLTRIGETLDLDDEALIRVGWQPDAFGLLLDADEHPSSAFDQATKSLQVPGSFPPLASLERIGQIQTTPDADGRRCGIFVFPDGRESGTVELLLLALGEEAFPELHQESRKFTDSWIASHVDGQEFTELRKPAGPYKAQLSTMTAMLKPGKSPNVSFQDHDWVPKAAIPRCLEPLVTFLEALLELERTIR